MDFAEFWKMYPRRIARKDAQKMWARLSEQQQAKAMEQLPLHTKVWNAEGRQPHLIPHAATWLNGERFEDELQMPEKVTAAWWTSDQATMDYGRKVGVPAKPGMSMAAYRDYLRQAA